MDRIASAMNGAYSRFVDMLFACGGSCCGLKRFYWFNLAEGLRG